MRKILRKRYRFYGRVQGVGFRYVARHAATLLGITGFVQNEYDGSVTMEAQGTSADLDDLLSMIHDGRYIVIEEMEVKELPPEPDERSFAVRQY